jgi:FtsP/CotA-like multicopper oxidase with cupredoxin domain
LSNALPAATTIHWHGIRGPNGMDGVAGLTQPPVAPGDSFDYRLAPPDAGTFWYHAGTPTGGLYGLLIVDEPDPVDTDQDIPLVLGQWLHGPDAGLVAVNGRRLPTLPVRANERLRLRLLNAAPVPLAVRIEHHEPVVIAIGGQPAEAFPARDARVLLGPGNRVDLMVDAWLKPGATAPITVETDTGASAIAHLAYARDAPRQQSRTDILRLPSNPLPDRMAFRDALRAELPLGAARAPAADGGFGRPAFSVARGRTVTLALVNKAAIAHVVHVHGHSFRLLDALDDGWKPFWLDTLVVPPAQTMRIAFVADNPGRWLIGRQAIGAGEPGPPAWFAVT